MGIVGRLFKFKTFIQVFLIAAMILGGITGVDAGQPFSRQPPPVREEAQENKGPSAADLRRPYYARHNRPSAPPVEPVAQPTAPPPSAPPCTGDACPVPTSRPAASSGHPLCPGSLCPVTPARPGTTSGDTGGLLRSNPSPHGLPLPQPRGPLVNASAYQPLGLDTMALAGCPPVRHTLNPSDPLARPCQALHNIHVENGAIVCGTSAPCRGGHCEATGPQSAPGQSGAFGQRAAGSGAGIYMQKEDAAGLGLVLMYGLQNMEALKETATQVVATMTEKLQHVGSKELAQLASALQKKGAPAAPPSGAATPQPQGIAHPDKKGRSPSSAAPAPPSQPGAQKKAGPSAGTAPKLLKKDSGGTQKRDAGARQKKERPSSAAGTPGTTTTHPQGVSGPRHKKEQPTSGAAPVHPSGTGPNQKKERPASGGAAPASGAQQATQKKERPATGAASVAAAPPHPQRDSGATQKREQPSTEAPAAPPQKKDRPASASAPVTTQPQGRGATRDGAGTDGEGLRASPAEKARFAAAVQQAYASGTNQVDWPATTPTPIGSKSQSAPRDQEPLREGRAQAQHRPGDSQKRSSKTMTALLGATQHLMQGAPISAGLTLATAGLEAVAGAERRPPTPPLQDTAGQHLKRLVINPVNQYVVTPVMDTVVTPVVENVVAPFLTAAIQNAIPPVVQPLVDRAVERAQRYVMTELGPNSKGGAALDQVATALYDTPFGQMGRMGKAAAQIYRQHGEILGPIGDATRRTLRDDLGVNAGVAQDLGDLVAHADTVADIAGLAAGGAGILQAGGKALLRQAPKALGRAAVRKGMHEGAVLGEKALAQGATRGARGGGKHATLEAGETLGAKAMARAAAQTGAVQGEKAAARAGEQAAGRQVHFQEDGITRGAAAPAPQRVRENVVRANENPYNFTSDTFKAPVEWTSPTGTRQTYQVHQRTDIDWNMVRTQGDRNFLGRTNAEAARAGLAPQLPDGSLATLHHVGQDARGPLVEASRRYHGVGKVGQSQLHGQFGPSRPHPENPVNHRVWEKEQKKYWKERVKNGL